MDSSHSIGNVLRKGYESVTQGLDEGVRRLRGLVANRAPSDEQEDEFESMLADLDAEPTEDEGLASSLRLAEATIAELRASLEQLQPLGERFAEAERGRLALLEELEAARADEPSAEPNPALEREVKRLRKEIDRRDRRIASLTDRLERSRERYAARDRVATERWHELVQLRREKRKAEQAARR